MTIEEFIEARLAEDETVANAAGGDRWAYDSREDLYREQAANGEVYRPDSTREYSYGNGHVGHEYSYVTCDREGLSSSVDRTEGEHIARHDPARALRQVAVLRAVVELIEGMVSVTQQIEAENTVLYPLAAIWQDHPDYRPEWDTPDQA